jgi:type 1 fimbria pilin
MNKTRIFAAIAGMAAACAQAQYLPQCNKPVVTLAPPLPNSFVSVPRAGHIAWSGQISVQINNCGAPGSNLPGSLEIAMPINSRLPMPLAGVTGLALSGTGAAPTWSLSCGSAYSMQSNPEDASPMGSPSTSVRLNVQPGAPACSRIAVNFPAQIMATGAPISGTLSPLQLVDAAPPWFGGGAGGWVTFNNQTPVAGLGPYSVDMKSVQCTVAVTHQVVALPAMTASTLATQRLGAAIPFEVALKGCSPSSTPYGVKLQWNWAAPPQAGATSTIANTATNGASNVSIQLLDDHMALIENGKPSNFGAAMDTGAGQITRKFYARYHADGGPITAGGVSGVADFTIIYN